MLAALIFWPLLATASARVDVTGDYASNWDDVHLVQEGDRIHGTYVCCGGGTIEGRIIEGRIIKFEWDEPRGAGHGAGIWTIKGSTLQGTWGHAQSNSDGGPWTLERKTKRSQIAN
ncbi:MAG TPA: hypothetical protein VMZ53_27725 [Kofleriaceae bacterium]|nr:hypothetical protein [Kofleriaceae bacterium]